MNTHDTAGQPRVLASFRGALESQLTEYARRHPLLFPSLVEASRGRMADLFLETEKLCMKQFVSFSEPGDEGFSVKRLFPKSRYSTGVYAPLASDEDQQYTAYPTSILSFHDSRYAEILQECTGEGLDIHLPFAPELSLRLQLVKELCARLMHDPHSFEKHTKRWREYGKLSPM